MLLWLATIPSLGKVPDEYTGDDQGGNPNFSYVIAEDLDTHQGKGHSEHNPDEGDYPG